MKNATEDAVYRLCAEVPITGARLIDGRKLFVQRSRYRIRVWIGTPVTWNGGFIFGITPNGLEPLSYMEDTPMRLRIDKEDEDLSHMADHWIETLKFYLKEGGKHGAKAGNGRRNSPSIGF